MEAINDAGGQNGNATVSSPLAAVEGEHAVVGTIAESAGDGDDGVPYDVRKHKDEVRLGLRHRDSFSVVAHRNMKAVTANAAQSPADPGTPPAQGGGRFLRHQDSVARLVTKMKKSKINEINRTHFAASAELGLGSGSDHGREERTHSWEDTALPDWRDAEMHAAARSPIAGSGLTMDGAGEQPLNTSGSGGGASLGVTHDAASRGSSFANNGSVDGDEWGAVGGGSLSAAVEAAEAAALAASFRRSGHGAGGDAAADVSAVDIGAVTSAASSASSASSLVRPSSPRLPVGAGSMISRPPVGARTVAVSLSADGDAGEGKAGESDADEEDVEDEDEEDDDANAVSMVELSDAASALRLVGAAGMRRDEVGGQSDAFASAGGEFETARDAPSDGFNSAEAAAEPTAAAHGVEDAMTPVRTQRSLGVRTVSGGSPPAIVVEANGAVTGGGPQRALRPVGDASVKGQAAVTSVTASSVARGPGGSGVNQASTPALLRQMERDSAGGFDTGGTVMLTASTGLASSGTAPAVRSSGGGSDPFGESGGSAPAAMESASPRAGKSKIRSIAKGVGSFLGLRKSKRRRQTDSSPGRARFPDGIVDPASSPPSPTSAVASASASPVLSAPFSPSNSSYNRPRLTTLLRLGSSSNVVSSVPPRGALGGLHRGGVDSEVESPSAALGGAISSSSSGTSDGRSLTDDGAATRGASAASASAGNAAAGIEGLPHHTDGSSNDRPPSVRLQYPPPLLSASMGPLVGPAGLATAPLPPPVAPPPPPTPPRSILKGGSGPGRTGSALASTAKRTDESGNGHASSDNVKPGDGADAALAAAPPRRITFADQHGQELDLVHYCEDLHYSAGADHSQSEDYDDSSRCVVA